MILSPVLALAQANAPSKETLKPYTELLPDSTVKLEMIPIPAGSIAMGGKKIEVKPFFIANMETSWQAFDVFTASGPPTPAYDQTPFAPDAIARPSKSYIPPDKGWGHFGFPAIHISNMNAQMFCRWLSSKTGKKYRLPTEAEWEFACRAGASAAIKPTPAQLAKSAWFVANSEEVTHPIGKRLPNAWKLYDMLGNVGEWATDSNGKYLLCGGAFNTPLAKLTPVMRARQTPEWQSTDPQLPKSRWWLSDAPFAGFRVVCEP